VAPGAGHTRPQARGLVATQASVLALTGLLFGARSAWRRRTTWRVVADYTPLQYVARGRFWRWFCRKPLALLLANLLPPAGAAGSPVAHRPCAEWRVMGTGRRSCHDR